LFFQVLKLYFLKCIFNRDTRDKVTRIISRVKKSWPKLFAYISLPQKMHLVVLTDCQLFVHRLGAS